MSNKKTVTVSHSDCGLRLRLFLRSLGSRWGIVSEDIELGSPHAVLLPHGPESVTLDQLPTLPEEQQVDETEARSLLSEKEEYEKEVEEEEGEKKEKWGAERKGERGNLVGNGQKSYRDTRTKGGGEGRQYREVTRAPTSAPPALALPFNSASSATRYVVKELLYNMKTINSGRVQT